MVIDVLDVEDANIVRHFDEALQFIGDEHLLNRNSACLVRAPPLAYLKANFVPICLG
jgi:hypothetical protein